MSYLLTGATNEKNPLLIKDEQGKVKHSTFDLPPEDHAYGKKVVDNPMPINQVTHSWDLGQQSQAHHPQNNKDFRQLNKLTVISGLHTAKQQTDFRKTHTIPIKQKYGSKYIPVMLPEQDFTYGDANRPSTPVKLVIGNCYALMAEDKNKELYETRCSKSVNSKKLGFKDTRNHELLKDRNRRFFVDYQNKPNKEEQFKLTKFTGTTGPKVNTNLQSFGLTSLKIT